MYIRAPSYTVYDFYIPNEVISMGESTINGAYCNYFSTDALNSSEFSQLNCNNAPTFKSIPNPVSSFDVDFQYDGNTGGVNLTSVKALCKNNAPTPTPTMPQTNTPTATETSTPTPYSPDPGSLPPGGVSAGALLKDGDMEQQPKSSYWGIVPIYLGLLDDNTEIGLLSDGRMSNNNLLNTISYGRSRCGNGYQTIGYSQSIINFGRSEGFGNIEQQFYVPYRADGTYYYRFSLMGKNSDPTYQQVPFKIYVFNTNTRIETVLREGAVNDDNAWHDYSGNVNLMQGNYQFWVKMAQPTAGMQRTKTFLKVDDVNLASFAMGAACSAVVDPNPQPTPTTYPTYSSINYIKNCGFEQTTMSTSSRITSPDYWYSYDELFIDNTNANQIGNYAIMTLGGASKYAYKQKFWWYGGYAFTGFYANRTYNVYFKNTQTGSIIPVAKSTADSRMGWDYIQNSVYLPSGNYDIVLDHSGNTAPGTLSMYDGVTVSTLNYVSCDPGTHDVVTPPAPGENSPTPTPWRTNTPAPTHTQPPTSTPFGGGPTATPRPTYTLAPSSTPYPTYTPYIPPTASATSRSTATKTAWPTWTAQPTYTPLPTLTLNSWQLTAVAPTSTTLPGTPSPTMDWPLATSVAQTLTPQPPQPTSDIPGSGLLTQTPPPQPPPDYGADCIRPQSGNDVAGWIEYNTCQALSYFSWSSNGQATLEAWPTTITNREPFGTINEANQSMQDINTMLNSMDSGTPLPGVSTPVSLTTFFDQENNFLQTGRIEYDPTIYQPNYSCTTNLAGVIGQLAMGYCMFFNMLAEKGIMSWIQLILNVCCIGFLLTYIWRKWIDAGSGA